MKLKQRIFEVWKNVVFLLLFITLVLNILNLSNAFYLNYYFGKWLPFWASVSSRITGLCLLITILLVRDKEES